MRILSWDELKPRQRAAVALLDWTDGDAPSLAARVAAERSTSFYGTLRPIFGLVGDRLVGRVSSLDRNLRSDRGDAPVLGICDVETAPTELGRGIAGRLLEEVHRRNSGRCAGFFLWTRRSWGAHRLYERLGYRDVYSPEVLLRRLPARRGRTPGHPVRFRPARPKEASVLERMLRRSNEGRIGLLPRPGRSFETWFRLGFRRPRDYQVIERRGEPFGYLWARRDEHQVLCEEIVAVHREDQGLVLAELEHWAAGRWLAISTTTFTRDQAARFRARGYLRSAESHRVLMFRGRGADSRPEVQRVRRIFQDPRLALHDGDRF